MKAYLEKQPDGIRREEIIVKLEQFYFDKTSDLAGMQVYLKELPNGSRAKEVHDKIEQLYFDKSTDLAGMELYLKDLPDGKRISEVTEKIEQYYFDNAKGEAGFKNYLSALPDGKRRELVIKQLAELKRSEEESKLIKANAYENELFEKAIDERGILEYLTKLPNGKRKDEVITRFINGISVVDIPAGSFTMGCADAYCDNQDETKPIRTVHIKKFGIGKTEVTFDQFDIFSIATKRGLIPDNFNSGRGSHPATGITRIDAVAFLSWLSQKSGKKFRFPSESEWEYACRAGKRQRYCGSDNIDDVGWVEIKQPKAVGLKRANDFGLHDMSGNAEEMTQDCFHKNYVGAPSDGQAWITPDCDPNDVYVVRGGEFISDKFFSQSQKRDTSGPRYYPRDTARVGLRIAMSK